MPERREMLQDPGRQTAVVVANDMMALGVMQECRAAGLSIPADLSIVGFDDIAMCQRLWPPLTTVRQPTKGAARAATEMLLNCLDSGDLSPANEELQGELVIRESAGRPSGE